MSTKLPASLTGAYVTGLVLALLLGCCSAYSSIGLAAYIAMKAESGPSDYQLARVADLQREALPLQVIDVALQLVAAIALGAGCGVGLSGRRIGRPLALGAFALLALGVMFDAGVAVWSWLELRSALVIEDAEAPMLGGIILVSMLPKVLWMLIRLAVAAGGAAGILSPSAREYYANAPAEGVRGSRE